MKLWYPGNWGREILITKVSDSAYEENINKIREAMTPLVDT